MGLLDPDYYRKPFGRTPESVGGRRGRGQPRRGASPALLGCCIVVVLVGVGLLWVGWRLEASGFWDSHPFLTNVASSFVAAFFGVPLALVVLQRIIASQADRLQRANVSNLAWHSMVRFDSVVQRFLLAEEMSSTYDRLILREVGEIGHGIQLLGAELLEAQNVPEWKEQYRWYPTALRSSPSWEAAGGELIQRIRQASQRNLDLLGSVDADSSRSMQVHWSAMKDEWSFIVSTVRPRVLEVGLKWIKLESEATISRFLSQDAHNLKLFDRWRDRSNMFHHNVQAVDLLGLPESAESGVWGHRDAVDDVTEICVGMNSFRHAVDQAFHAICMPESEK